ncbi:magnesium transporter [Microbacterium bovistercoris]|uniref:Magnesium transporter MgtE n=1 Tax=Microbacterium bovistercoris TaxID=2293570 RepID=A0A371NPG1_9MICO|nr:magnesium transporter [Microbacterium bovistercoris]REJ04030.1 magnesium transporter [Microbacterium bovistercoris]
MTPTQLQNVAEAADTIGQLLSQNDLAGASAVLTPLTVPEVVELVDRLSIEDAAILYRLLAKGRALEVFEALSPGTQGDLVQALRNAEVTTLFAEMDPDDRVWLLDELPASVAPRLLRGLTRQERDLTSGMLGYPQDSIGRRMSPEFVTTHPQLTVAATMARVRGALDSAETVYTLPVTDHGRRVVGVVSLRDLMGATDDALIGDLMHEAHIAVVSEDAETAARRTTDYGLLALPIVDGEDRLVGILTIDDAARILKQEESEDAARQGGVEPLRRSYLSTPIRRLVRSRVIWLLVLAVGATLTVQVLDTFEATLAQMTVLALFVPLLIGTGGNTGNQAATTVTRSLALGEVTPRDVLKVLSREVRTGFCLGLLLGLLGFAIAGLVYEWHVGLVIGLTLVAVCTVAASVGGMMPLAARAIRVDPAVFSNPFITTFVDATGLVIYFLIAKAVLGI